MNRKGFLFAVAALGCAISALAQLPGGHSNAPTNADYRMTIVEPLEGATITGTDVTIVFGQPVVPTGQSVNEKERRDVMTPIYQVWVDGKDFGNLAAGQNVFVARDVSYGHHKITVAAKNTAGELVDRKEIGITTVAAAVVQQRTTESTATDSRPSSVAPPAPAAPRAVEAPAPAPPPSEPYTSQSPALPKTASSYPRVLAAGLGLLVAGFALRRRGL